jgi:hypothetical protein
MPFHQGRLIGHVHLRVSDLEASRRFSRAVLQALGRDLTSEGPEHCSSDELWIDRTDGPVSRVHLAFQARDRESVHALMRRRLPMADATMAGRASAPAMPAPTPPSRSIRTATTSKRCSTGPRNAPPNPLSPARSVNIG